METCMANVQLPHSFTVKIMIRNKVCCVKQTYDSTVAVQNETISRQLVGMWQKDILLAIGTWIGLKKSFPNDTYIKIQLRENENEFLEKPYRSRRFINLNKVFK